MLWLCRAPSTLHTLSFNPDQPPLTPYPIIAGTLDTILSLYDSGAIDYPTYLQYNLIASTAFYVCVVEQFGDQGGMFASTRINVGELSHPLNGAGFINDSALSQKLGNLLWKIKN